MKVKNYLKILLKSTKLNYFYLGELLLLNLTLFSLVLISFVININGFSDKSYIVNYFLIAAVTNFTLSSIRTSKLAHKLAISGEISNYLIRPVDPFKAFFTYIFGETISRLILIFIFSVIITTLFGYLSEISLLSLIKLPIAFLISTLFYYYLYKATFYLVLLFEKLDFIDYINKKLISFIGGGTINLSILSEKLKFLPYYYFVGFESDLVLGKTELIHFILAIVYLVLLVFIAEKLKKRALRKIEINGG